MSNPTPLADTVRARQKEIQIKYNADIAAQEKASFESMKAKIMAAIDKTITESIHVMYEEVYVVTDKKNDLIINYFTSEGFGIKYNCDYDTESNYHITW